LTKDPSITLYISESGSLEIASLLGNKLGEGITLHSLACIDLIQNNYQDAKYKLLKSIAIVEQIGHRDVLAGVLDKLAQIEMTASNNEEALEMFLHR
jgi:hypothetical protein